MEHKSRASGRKGGRELAEPLHCRLWVDQRQRYEALAQEANISLSEYLRRRLEGEDQTLDVLDSISETLASIEAQVEGGSNKKGQNQQGADANSAILLELLLLVRSLFASSRNNEIEYAQGEVKRHGLEPWKPLR